MSGFTDRQHSVNQKTVRNWIAVGKLPAFRVGGRLRVSRADALAFVEPVEVQEVPRVRTRREHEAHLAEVDRVLREAGVRR